MIGTSVEDARSVLRTAYREAEDGSQGEKVLSRAYAYLTDGVLSTPGHSTAMFWLDDGRYEAVSMIQEILSAPLEYASSRILRRVETYLQKGTLGSPSYSTYNYRGEDPQEIVENAQAYLTTGTWGSALLWRVKSYLNGEVVTQHSEKHTTKAFFTHEGELLCLTQSHELDEDGEQQCDCREAGCGCVVNDVIPVCERCEQCKPCCDDDGECYHCGNCDKVVNTSDVCASCSDCQDCCNDSGSCFYCERCEKTRSSDDQCGTCSRCSRCCSCWHCDGCRSGYDEDTFQCGDCGRCEDCCSCTTCGDCNNHVNNWCANCDSCGDCCAGDDDCSPYTLNSHEGSSSRPPIRARDLVFHDSSKTQFKHNTLKRHISVEMEVDRCGTNVMPKKLNAAIVKWKDSVVEDGSLSGPFAHEVNTMPTNGDRFLEHVKDLCDGYAELKATAGPDCGMHVHVNCKDLTFYDMRKVLMLYHKVERALFELCRSRRLNGDYSRVCGFNYINMSTHPSTFKRQLLSTLYVSGTALMDRRPDESTGEKVREAKSSKSDGLREYQMRYRALNIHSFFHRGSIEFRHHEGTTDYNEAINWALICGHVIDAAQKLSEAKLAVLPTDSFEALLAVLPERFHDFCKGKWTTTSDGPIFDGVAKPRYGRRDTDQYWLECESRKGTLPTKTAKEVQAEHDSKMRAEGRCVDCFCRLTDGLHTCGCYGTRCVEYPVTIPEPPTQTNTTQNAAYQQLINDLAR